MEFLLQLRRVAVGNDFIWMLAYREERPLACIFHKMYKNKNQFKMTKTWEAYLERTRPLRDIPAIIRQR